MSIPTAAILKKYSRQDTYQRGEANRANWIKAERRAKKSYLKYVARKGYYSHLEYHEYQRNGFIWREYYRPYNGYTHGYPSFYAPRCQLRDQWERKFEDHRRDTQKRIDDAEMLEIRQGIAARERIYTLAEGRGTGIITMAKAISAITKYATDRTPAKQD